MTWIRTIPPAQADESLQAHYHRVYRQYPSEYHQPVQAIARPDGTADSVIESHSLFPGVMEHIFSAFGLLIAEDMPLTRRQQEMITTVVSAANRCYY